MMSLYELLFEPFASFAFMRRALVACLALSLSCGPIGTLLVLRRMSLAGDALAHAVLPGVAVGFLISGFSTVAMSLGGFVAGIVVAVLSAFVSQATPQREDASFAAFYLISLALGVLIISVHGSSVDLMHVLFGSILAVDRLALLLVVSAASVTLLIVALFYRPLIVSCFDPGFLRAVGGPATAMHLLFPALVVLNLIAGFQALGTLMAVGLMMLPAAAARFWADRVASLFAVSVCIAFLCGYAGLVISYHADLPTGPTIVLLAGVVYVLSVIVGPHGGLRTRRNARLRFSA